MDEVQSRLVMRGRTILSAQYFDDQQAFFDITAGHTSCGRAKNGIGSRSIRHPHRWHNQCSSAHFNIHMIGVDQHMAFITLIFIFLTACDVPPANVRPNARCAPASSFAGSQTPTARCGADVHILIQSVISTGCLNGLSAHQATSRSLVESLIMDSMRTAHGRTQRMRVLRPEWQPI
jgi:hypothetical protein